MNTATIRTNKGLTIMLQHDVSSPNVYSRIHKISGTKGSALKYPLAGRFAIGHENWLSEAEYKKKAFALSDRVSEYERDSIAAGYYQSTGELDKTVGAYRVVIGNYPRNWGSHNNLSENLMTLGEFEEALEEGQKAFQSGKRIDWRLR